jgi:UDP-MurNAc hydroxylase
MEMLSMDATLLGHASFLIEHGDTCLLIDPVFSDPFQGDLVVSCPQRVVHIDRLPRIDAVLISHAHLDHYHSPSIARCLRPGLPIFCPADPELVAMLYRDGAVVPTPIAPFEPFKVGSIEVCPTPSLGHELELGFVLAADGSSIWNQVDTVVTQETCARVLDYLGGRLDVAVCTYRPLIEYAAVWVEESAFPRERYERLIEMAICCRARTIIPGSAGLRCPDDYAWPNHRVFPATRAGFVEDLRAIAPEIDSLILDPGQAVRIDPEQAVRVDTPYATTVQQDEWRVEFRPATLPPPELRDDNPRGHPEEQMREWIREVVEVRLASELSRRLDGNEIGPLRTLHDRRTALQIEVVFPSGITSWHVAAWAPELTVAQGAHADPDYVFRYIASSEYDLCREGIPPLPRCFAFRRAAHTAGTGPMRLSALDPARLHGRDVYFSVDETYDWNPLALLY